MDTSSMHNAFIFLHAATATLAFLAGWLLVSSTKYFSSRWLFSVYLWSLIAMALLLAGAIVAYWNGYSDIERVVFPGLLGLALFMLFLPGEQVS